VPVLLTDLAAGHVFEPITFTVDPDRVNAYLASAGDRLSLYGAARVVPPLAIAAFALGALLEQVSLPPGTLHASESLTFKAPVAFGARLECRATLAQRSQRAGWIVSVLDSEISAEGALAVVARATVLSQIS
jgi:acyl dehydratase